MQYVFMLESMLKAWPREKTNIFVYLIVFKFIRASEDVSNRSVDILS